MPWATFQLRTVVGLLWLALQLGLPTSAATAHSARETPPAAAKPEVLAPGWTPLAFDPPAPGTYELPPLGMAADGPVLTSDGTPTTLHTLFGKGLTLLSFVYTTCPDINGCPLATAVLAKLHTHVVRDSTLGEHVRLLTLSIDPLHDTPKAMRAYGAGLTRSTDTWRFLTTESEAALAPLLSAYDQSIAKDYDADGILLSTISHVLRVILIDQTRRIRNVYNVSFLHADSVLADMRTLLAEQHSPTQLAHTTIVASHAVPAPPGSLQGSGDNNTGYAHDFHETRTHDLNRRRGTATDLLALARTPPLGLPALPTPTDNPLTASKIALGRKLFFDRRLSLNDTLSCAMCHIAEQGFTSNEMRTAIGIEGRTVRRNAPSIYNVGYQRRLFHDGREHSLEQQIWGPLLAPNEMGNPSVGHVIETLRGLVDYDGRFEAAFAGRGPGMRTVGAAIASYERALVSADTPFDRWHFGDETTALPPAAQRGFQLFTGKGRCAACHTLADTHALFTDGELHNTGIGYRASMVPEPTTHKVQVAPGVTLNVLTASYAASTEPSPSDLGRYEITRDPADRWKYRTPTLRNIALTAPYMHDGSLATLRAVVEFYDAGGVAHALLDPRITKLDLDPSEIEDLVTFLGALTGANVDTLVADAFAAPVGDVGAAPADPTHSR